MTWATMVKRFHEEAGDPAPRRVVPFDRGEAKRRARMLREELNELEAARHAGSLLDYTRESLDCIYVLIGSLVAQGVPVHACFREVHRANMTKLVEPVVRDPSSGKVLKGKSFTPPDLASILRRSQTSRVGYDQHDGESAEDAS